MQLLCQTCLGLQQESLSTTSVNSERILGLKPCNRFKAAKAATGSTPRMNAGACAPPSGQAAQDLATRFDQRNGNDYYLNQLSELEQLRVVSQEGSSEEGVAA
jgi:hypothetical protein